VHPTAPLGGGIKAHFGGFDRNLLKTHLSYTPNIFVIKTLILGGQLCKQQLETLILLGFEFPWRLFFNALNGV
jgi:hypothetical protein